MKRNSRTEEIAVAKGSGRHFVSEALESRTLLTAVVVQSIGNQVFAQDSGAEQAYLYGVFGDNNGQQDLTFSATSTNPAVLTASVSGSVLTITPVTGQSGFARVQMVATDPTGEKAVNTLRVQITAADTRSLDVLLGAGSPNSIRYVESNGVAATVTLNGPGSAVLHFGGDNLSRAATNLRGFNAELESVTLSNTTTSSILEVVGKPSRAGFPSMGNVTATGSLGRLYVHNAILDGDVNVAGSLPSIAVDYAEGGTLTVGSGAVSIAGKSFVDENFSSSSPVNSVKLLQWTNSDNVSESFSAAFVRSLSVRGNFTPGLVLSGDGAPGRTLGSVRIPGTIGGTWKITGASPALNVGNTASDFDATFDSLPSFSSRLNLGGKLTAPTIKSIIVRNWIIGATINLTAAGTTDVQSIKAKVLTGVTISAAGNIGTIATAALMYSSVLAGATQPGYLTLPDSAAAFVGASAIQSIKISGGTKPNGFNYTDVVASSLGSLSLGNVVTDNSGITFGVAAGAIGNLDFIANKKHILLSNVQDPATLSSQLSAQNASLGDMTVEILQ